MTNVTGVIYPEHDGGFCRIDGTGAIYTFVVVLALVALLATFENLVVLILLIKYEVLRTPSIILLGVLAFIDFLTGAIITPMKIVITIEERLFNFSFTFLHAFICGFWGVIFTSLSTIFLISIDRFLNVYFLQRYKLDMKKLIIGISVSWIGPFVIIYYWSGASFHEAINMFAIAYLLFCIVGMIILYIAMIIVLKRHASNGTNSNNQTYIESQKRAVNTTLIIIVMCIVLNAPASVFIILEEYVGMPSDSLCAISFFTLLASPAVNPLIYCFRIPIMRNHVYKLFGMKRALHRNEGGDEEAFISVCNDDTNM